MKSGLDGNRRRDEREYVGSKDALASCFFFLLLSKTMLQKHFANSLTFKPQTPNTPYKKPYRLILNSTDRDQGTIDNATFYVDFKDPNLMNGNPFMMCLESFTLMNTTTPGIVDNVYYYVRLGNMERSFTQGKASSKDVLQTVQGRSYFNTLPDTNSLGVSIVDKGFFQNSYFRVYFTQDLNAYSAANQVAGIADANSQWSLTLTFWELPEL